MAQLLTHRDTRSRRRDAWACTSLHFIDSLNVPFQQHAYVGGSTKTEFEQCRFGHPTSTRSTSPGGHLDAPFPPGRTDRMDKPRRPPPSQRRICAPHPESRSSLFSLPTTSRRPDPPDFSTNCCRNPFQEHTIHRRVPVPRRSRHSCRSRDITGDDGTSRHRHRRANFVDRSRPT